MIVENNQMSAVSLTISNLTYIEIKRYTTLRSVRAVSRKCKLKRWTADSLWL